MPWATSWHGTSTATICFKWVKKQHHPSRLSSLHCLHPLSLCPPFFFGLPGSLSGLSGSFAGFEPTVRFRVRIWGPHLELFLQSFRLGNKWDQENTAWMNFMICYYIFKVFPMKHFVASKTLWHSDTLEFFCHHKPVAELKMPLVFAPHLVFDGSVGHHTSWIPRIKSYESHDHDEWVNPIPNPELIQKHPTEVFGLTFTILKKVLDILRSYVVLLCRTCPLCCSTWTMEWCLAHFWDLEKAAMAHSWKVKKCDSAGIGTKKSNQKNY